MNTQTIQEKVEAAEWLETDAAYLEKQAAIYAARGGPWYGELSQRLKANAEHSANWAAELRREIA